jgi:hypothetical protein
MRYRLAFAAALLAYGRPAPALTWTVPGTVNASGLNGTQFVSDLAITNPGDAPAIAILALVPANGTAQSTQFLQPGQTLVVRNALQQLWGATGAAATVVSSTAPLLIRARTYNTAASGTYGVALPAVASDRLLSPGDSADSLWISQSADGSTGYRTNVAVVFPDPAGGDATVTVYDASGNAIGSQAFTVASAGFQQFAVGAFAGAVAVSRARIVVTRGHATAYAVVVDNVTGDSSLFAFEDLPAGRQDVLLNGVARASGRNATFFRTDARLYNQTTADATVTVYFHSNQPSNPAPATASVTVPAGQILDVVDVLQTFLGLPVGSAGALRFTSDAPVAILCRTSNVDPSGAKPGTFGAQQRPSPVLSFLTSADAGAVVTGIRQGTSFRTNIGFAAGADGASWTLTLKDASGSAVATASGSLGAWGWTQPNVQDLFPSVTVPADATLLVNVTAGSVDVFDSSIDNASGDPVVTPIMPLPVALPSSATIGPAGGSVQSSDGRLTLKVPAGALASPTAFALTPAANGAPGGLGSGYQLSPGGVAFARPVRLVFAYSYDDANGSDPGSLGLAWQGGSSWYTGTNSGVDTRARTVTLEVPALELALRSGGKRAPLAAADVYSPYVALGLTGPSIALQGAGVDFSAAIVLLTPQSTGVLRLSPDARVSTFGYTWSAEAGTFGAGSGATGHYTAPGCPPQAPVRIRVDVHDAASGGPIGVLEKTVRILWKDWKYIITETTVDLGSCGLGFGLNYSSQAEATFSLDANGAATGVATRTVFVTNSVTACPGTPLCSATQTDPDPVTITSLTLQYFRGDLVFNVAYVHMSDTTVTVTCPDGTGVKPKHPGRSDDTLGAPVDAYAGGQNTTSNGDVSEEVHPVRGGC